MKKAIGQTVRELKREVNKKVLKVPGIEQKVLDATNNESWGPHGSLLADIALATRNYHEYQMIMAIIWKRINDTGKNWRHVYKALTVLEYLVGHGSERVIDEIREHAHQISTLSDFQYIDSGGRDQGNNVRRKSQSLVLLVNDKERIIEVRQKAAANRDKFRNNAPGGMYRPGSYSSSGAYGDRYEDDRYGNRDEDRSGYGYGREREGSYKDDDRYSHDGDHYGRDYEERYSRDGYRDDEYRRRSVDEDQYGSRSRNSDRDHDHNFYDDGQRSSRGSSAKAEDHSLEGRLEQKLSEQNVAVPPSYEEAVSQSPLHNERDGGISAASAPGGGASPLSDNPHQTSVPTGSSLLSHNPTEANASTSTATHGTRAVEAFDEFDPRVPVSAAPTTANNVEMDLFGSQSKSFSSSALALVPSESETATSQGDTVHDSMVSFATPLPSNNFNPVFEDPFGDSPFKAIPSTETAPSQPQTHKSLAPSQSSVPNTESVSDFGLGDSFSATTGANDTRSQFLPKPSPSHETDILADILPPAPLPGTTSQQNFSAPPNVQSSSGQTTSQSFYAQPGETAPQAWGGQPPQPSPSVSRPTSQHAQQSFPAHADQSSQPGGHVYAGFPSQVSYLTQGTSGMFPQSQGGHMNQTYEQRSVAAIPLHAAPQASTGQMSQFNSGNFMAQQGNAAPFNHQPLGQGVHAPHNDVSLPSKDKFETKSTVWADTLSRGLVNLNISGSKINPLADIGVDFDAINRKEKRMEKLTTTMATSTVTMGKAMGSGSGMGQASAGALRPSPNPMMGVGVGMGGYRGMNAPMGMGMNMGMGQMQPPPGNYNFMMGSGGYPQHPYGRGGYQ